jgi:hypothetical protein
MGLFKIAYTSSKENNESMEGFIDMELAKITSKGQITIPMFFCLRSFLKATNWRS